MDQARNKATKTVLEIELAELDSKIASATLELGSLKTDTKSAKIRKAQAERRLKECVAKYERQEADFKKREKELKSDLETVASKYKVAQEKSDGQTHELESTADVLRSAIKRLVLEKEDRTKYLKEQEAIIQSTLDDGAGRIADLDYQVKQVLKQQQEVLEEVNALSMTRMKLETDVTMLTDKRAELESTYKEAVERYRGQLDDFRRQIDEAAHELSMNMAASKRRVELLRTKEQELELREEVLNTKEADLADKQRFIDSRTRMLK
jgi:chromosome segregation ATPase